MHAAVIVNPGSGHLRARTRGGESRVSLAERLVAASGVRVDVVATQAAGHGRDLAESFAARGYERVIAWGGDGTINEVAGPLIGTATALGVVSAGSGNGFAHSIGLPRDPAAALNVALTAPAIPVDIGLMGHRHFLNVAGVGFDATVSTRYEKRPTRGTATYVSESLTGVWSYGCEPYEVRAGDRTFTGPLFLIAFANGREYGSGLVMAPGASVTDGKLEMLVVGAGGPIRQFWRARRLFLRRMAPAEGLWRGSVTNASIRGARLMCHVDGETFEASGELNVVLQPGALMVAGASG